MGNAVSKVKAGPTKDFFVSMITRDIQLSDAIVELIDNSIDGIKRQKTDKYNDFFIKVKLNKDFFEIEDNCGGIDLKIATEYAFVFGKPKAARAQQECVETTGTFGIGMKRALFKMGNNFEVTSKAKTSSFILRVDVNEWMQDENEWDFLLAESSSSDDNESSQCGTKITVTSLYPSISKNFDYNVFINEVIGVVQRRANAEISKGLAISINGTKINGTFLTILNGGNVAPYKYSFESDDIKVMVIAGISAETDPDKAGWYIYCNNREVLSSDKSSLTTWKDDKDTTGIKYHNDFASFRGFVFFTSSYPERLPWNTSKTGIDSSSPIYREAHQHMVDAFKIISAELRKLAGLDEEIRSAVTKKLRNNSELQLHYYTAQNILNKTSIAFVEPYEKQVRIEVEIAPTTTISYSVEKKIVDKVKKALKVNTNKDVGLKTFEYYVDMEQV